MTYGKSLVQSIQDMQDQLQKEWIRMLATVLGRCKTCNRVLNDPGDPTTRDCGGDCLKCIADSGDPQAQDEIMKIEDGKHVE